LLPRPGGGEGAGSGGREEDKGAAAVAKRRETCLAPPDPTRTTALTSSLVVVRPRKEVRGWRACGRSRAATLGGEGRMPGGKVAAPDETLGRSSDR
jgi:hypothetical protein